MKATALPAPANAAPVNSAATAASAEPTDSASDFVGMLMQLLGGSAPGAVTSQATVKLLSGDDATQEREEPTELAAMLGLPLSAQMPWAAVPNTVSTAAEDPLQSLGLSASTGKEASAALLALTAELANTEVPGELTTEDGNGVGLLSAFSETLQARATQAEAAATRALHTPVGTQEWADELGARMTWMVDRGQQSASLRLSPDNLGPLEVRISITEDKASVWFGAAHADTRAAVELALPRLREMFAAQGLSLADAGVFREPPRDQSAPQRSFGADSNDPQQEGGEVVISTRSVSLLDAYA